MTEWTERDMPDQSGRVAVVTGANSGLGLVTATELARGGAHVVMAVRDSAAGERAAKDIRRTSPDAEIHVRQLDLASLRSVRAFAKGMNDDFPAIDLLVNNAGVLHLGPARTTDDGFETHFGVNMLGHFALTGLLLGALGRAEGARVVSISSTAHRGARLDLDDLMSRKNFGPRRAYARSKLACTVYGLELHRRLETAGSPVLSVVAHPGICRTNLSPRAFEDQWAISRAVDRATQRAFAPVQEGARSQLHAATAPGVRGGQFYGPSGFKELRGPVAPTEPDPRAADPECGKRLWAAAEELTGISYP
ncbi:short-chain dehydrogenase [Streptomyces camponoticapitis]|uniref:Short-chain dehydrogenase n=1 Tax=Streptomyces camponoticapitis TaxID=1616125 RepID=A0ABQ2EPX6_9ACTN|nr:oxidoreductase [Streptomyces camponoticapitis]GGK20755.1 short-chain dehydrogenase [Streptomyces camponoticapitis]